MREAMASRACAFRNGGANVAHEDCCETSLMTRVAVGGFLHETNTFASGTPPAKSRSPSATG